MAQQHIKTFGNDREEGNKFFDFDDRINKYELEETKQAFIDHNMTSLQNMNMNNNNNFANLIIIKCFFFYYIEFNQLFI